MRGTKMWSMVIALVVMLASFGAPSAHAASITTAANATTTTALNLRSGPSTNYAVQQVLPAGASVFVHAGPINTSWYDVSYNNVRGYVHGAYLQQGGSNGGGASSGTTTSALNLRTGPGTNYAVQVVLPSGTTVSIVEGPVNAVWWKVSYAGRTGYVHGDYLARGGNGSAKSIVIDLSDQWVYAYEGGVQVFASPTSTGKDGFNTPIGSFSVLSKHRYSTMQGSAGGETWYVPDVPFAMYFTDQGHAIHGAPWVPDYVFGSGTRLSHGCAGLSVGNAEWFFNWTPVGTPVQVRW